MSKHSAFQKAVPKTNGLSLAFSLKVIGMMPVAVAKEQGFFQKEGLNVEMVLMPASLNIKVLLSGDIQYATTITAGVVANVRGVNTRVVMCFVDRPLLDLVGSPEIGSIADLKGKLVAISSRGGLHDVTMWSARRSGP